jgi:hypothetical protein
MNRRSVGIGVVVLASLLASACTTMGTGTGETRGGGPGVRFDWTAEGAVKGQMTATFADGHTYSGKLFQITTETTVDSLAPMWYGWGGRWGGWPYWDSGPDFITHYTGRVVANLKDPNGNRMRCNFRLVDPDRGMSGGGQGKCQLSEGGATIDAEFPSV